MPKIFLLWLQPINQSPYVYKAFDNLENALAMGTSVLHEFDAPLTPSVTEVELDGALAVDQLPPPDPNADIIRVSDPTVPGGLPPVVDGQCPWCRQMCDPHFDLAMGLNIWHLKCIKEFDQRAGLVINKEQLPQTNKMKIALPFTPNDKGNYNRNWKDDVRDLGGAGR